jgi:hypothetical protein
MSGRGGLASVFLSCLGEVKSAKDRQLNDMADLFAPASCDWVNLARAWNEVAGARHGSRQMIDIVFEGSDQIVREERR